MDQPPADSVLDSWPTHLATAAITGLVTAYLPVHRWSPTARWTLHGGAGALAGGGMALALRKGWGRADGDRPDEAMAPLPTAGIAVAFGALVLAASRGGQAADEWAERSLTARGVRRPRLWLGVVAAGASLAMSVADARRAAEAGATSTEPSDDPKRSDPDAGS